MPSLWTSLALSLRRALDVRVAPVVLQLASLLVILGFNEQLGYALDPVALSSVQPFVRLPEVRLPPLPPEAGTVQNVASTAQTVTAISPTRAADPNAADRIAALEARVRQLEGDRAAESAASSPNSLSPDSLPESPDTGYVVGSDTSLLARWKYGLDLESKNKDFHIHIGGRTQYDNSFFANDPDLTVSPNIGGIGPQRDSFQFRRGRLRIEGTMYENFDFAAEYDFVNTLAPASPSSGQPVVAVPGITDLWGTVTHLPRIGNVRIGNMKEPIGMEHVNSSRFLPFIERSFMMDVVFGPFNNGFTPGVMMFDRRQDERATWAIGWFSAAQQRVRLRDWTGNRRNGARDLASRLRRAFARAVPVALGARWQRPRCGRGRNASKNARQHPQRTARRAESNLCGHRSHAGLDTLLFRG